MDGNNFKFINSNIKMENKANKYFRDEAYYAPRELSKALLDGYILQSVQDRNIILYLENLACGERKLVGIEVDWNIDGQKSFRISKIKESLILKDASELFETLTADKGRFYNILYVKEIKFHELYLRRIKYESLDGVKPKYNPISIDVLSKYKKDVQFKHTSMHSIDAERRNRAIVANATVLYEAHVLNRRAGHTVAMFRAYLRHIQNYADTIVIVGTNGLHVQHLKSTKKYVIQQLRDEFRERTKPNFFRSCLIKLGLSEPPEYTELGELYIVPLHLLRRFTEGRKSIIVFDNYVFLDLPNMK